jgi:hypothetical protein
MEYIVTHEGLEVRVKGLDCIRFFPVPHEEFIEKINFIALNLPKRDRVKYIEGRLGAYKDKYSYKYYKDISCGIVDKIDTSYYSVGEKLYISQLVPGSLTTQIQMRH